MKMNLSASQILLLGLALAGSLLNSGCVVGRRTVALPIPSLGGGALDKGEVGIGSVVDNRHFEGKPVAPSTPSVDGDVTTLTPDLKTMLIGRQRNGYGHAMGDIALPANDSITMRARLLFEEGLKRRGYTVAKADGAANSIDVSVDEFWAWFTPGFATVSFEAKIRCGVTIKHGDKVTRSVVEGYGKNTGQVASDANWQLAYSRAFAEFMVRLDRELGNAGF